MACDINASNWETRLIDSCILRVENGDYFLRLNLQTGENEDILLNESQPLALRISDEASGTLEFATADWGTACGEEMVFKFALNPGRESCGYTFRKDGTGIGTSDIRDNGLRVIQTSLNDAPLVLVKSGGDIHLRLSKFASNYYVSPPFSPV